MRVSVSFKPTKSLQHWSNEEHAAMQQPIPVVDGELAIQVAPHPYRERCNPRRQITSLIHNASWFEATTEEVTS